MSLLAVALTLMSSACGNGSEGATTSTIPPATTTTSTSTTESQPTTTSFETTTSLSTTTTTLPGEPIEFGPMEGDDVMVIGVSYNDVLNLRELPGTSFPVVAEIPPDYRELIALGNTRDIGPSFWIELDYEGTTGWVHFGFIAFEGVTDDMTAFVVDQLGERPTAATMPDLGLVVVDVFASDDPESSVVQVTEATVGDLGEVTFDVVGLGDDAVRGLRLHVFAEPLTDGFGLRTVEVTTLCSRGVTDDFLCT